jgi:hypothetical protein
MILKPYCFVSSVDPCLVLVLFFPGLSHSTALARSSSGHAAKAHPAAAANAESPATAAAHNKQSRVTTF